MHTTFKYFAAIAAAVLTLAGPGLGAPASPTTWNGDPSAVREYQDASTAYGAWTTYKSKITGTSAQGAFSMTVEWVRPKRMRMLITEPQQSTITIIDGARWVAVPGGNCFRMPGNVPMPVPDVDTPDRAQEGSITVTRAGTQTIDGVATNILDAVTVFGGKTAKKRTFIHPATKQFKRWELEDGGAKTTIDYLEYNTNIKIDPPC